MQFEEEEMAAAREALGKEVEFVRRAMNHAELAGAACCRAHTHTHTTARGALRDGVGGRACIWSGLHAMCLDGRVWRPPPGTGVQDLRLAG